ncbi:MULTISPECIES: ABC transporter permease [Clostridium]|uniref:ABC transporter permease n=1 Tax=Clostridium TaxID=1485 RepID=UPI000824231E|nr:MULTISPECIES: ABC transporter permease [Clostridium]PJI08966.1 ABC transporter permease [Clostridium sp. CT7]
MKPLGAANYLKNNLKKILPQFICVVLSVYFIYLISVLFYSSIHGSNSCGLNLVEKGIMVKARAKEYIPKSLISTVENDKDVGRIIPVVGDIGYFGYTSIFMSNTGITFNVFKEDVKSTVSLFHMKLIKGRMPRGDSNEIIIPLNFAKQNKIAVGDYLGKNTNSNIYLNDDYKVVGIMDGPCNIIITSNTENIGMSRSEALKHSFICSLNSEKQSNISKKLKSINGDDITFYDYESLKKQIYGMYNSVNVLKIILDGLIIFVLCISIVHINFVVYSNRKREFSTLNLIGYKKIEIYKKIFKENAVLNLVAFCVGTLVAALTMEILNIIIWEPKGEYAIVFKLEYFFTAFLVPLFVLIVNMIMPIKQIKSLRK